MKHLLKAVSLVGMFWAGSASAVLIDNFDGDNFAVTSVGTSGTVSAAGNAIGNAHEGQLISGGLGSGIGVAGGLLQVTSGADGTVAAMIWDQFTDVDLTEGFTIPGIEIDIVDVDIPASVDLTLTVENGGDSSAINLDFAGTGIRFFQFSLFDDPTVLVSADKIKLDIVITGNTDLLVDIIETRDPTGAVPAPMPLLLLSTGILGLGFIKRRNRA